MLLTKDCAILLEKGNSDQLAKIDFVRFQITTTGKLR
jgi:hypothetical protein